MTRTDIQIGDGHHGTGAHRMQDPYGEHLSENGKWYWIWSGLIVDVHVFIKKDTVEGKYITAAIERGVSLRRIITYVNKQMLKYIKPERLIHSIEKLKEEAYEEGRESKIKELKKVLSISYYD